MDEKDAVFLRFVSFTQFFLDKDVRKDYNHLIAARMRQTDCLFSIPYFMVGLQSLHPCKRCKGVAFFSIFRVTKA